MLGLAREKCFDVRYTGADGHQKWFGYPNDEAGARDLAKHLATFGDPYYAPIDVGNWLDELVARFPVDALIVWNGGTVHAAHATVVGHRLDPRFPGPDEVLLIRLDNGNLINILATYAGPDPANPPQDAMTQQP